VAKNSAVNIAILQLENYVEIEENHMMQPVVLWTLGSFKATTALVVITATVRCVGWRTACNDADLQNAEATGGSTQSHR